MILSLLAWAATAAILLTYLGLARGRSATPFHWANVVGAVILAIVNTRAGLWQNLVLNTAFGLVAAVALLRRPTEGEVS